MVSRQDIRDFLGQISEEDLPDETIDQMLDLARTKVNLVKSDAADSELVDQTIKVVAAYYCYVAYAGKLERGIGTTPPEVERQLSRLSVLYNEFITAVSRSGIVSQSGFHAPIELTASKYQTTVEEASDP
ncbi:MAG: hypothetical protein DRH17_13770 [Deltaproteobacteria bacterium]|nr:MAG: hypothetical protein DRH17_13770 [Deltaproteobacteria bacterium]